MATLAEIRAKLAQENNNKRSNGDKVTYPFWNADEGTTAVIRFLPDKNEDNTYFWKERLVIKLTFPGIKGHDENKEITIQVPCNEMWGGTCPILQEIRPWFKAGGEEEALARKYWKKRTYIFQGFVRETSLSEDEVPENPIRKFLIGPQIYDGIKNALVDSDFDSMPTDYVNGTDFKLVKSKKGSYADYSSSSWARKDSSLTEDEAEALAKYGLVDLETYLPERPSEQALKVIFEMFEASVAGDLYDPEAWASYYKPYNFDVSSVKTETTEKDGKSDRESTSQDSDTDSDAEDNSSTSSEKASTVSASDILAKIRQQ